MRILGNQEDIFTLYSYTKDSESCLKFQTIHLKEKKVVFVKYHHCDECAEGFYFPETLERHKNRQHSKKGKCPKTRCNVCDMLFTNMTLHMLTHTGERAFNCDKAFTQKGNLERHRLIYTGIKPHKCQECSASFTQNNGWFCPCLNIFIFFFSLLFIHTVINNFCLDTKLKI